MKKILVSLLLVLVIGSTTAFAVDEKDISRQVKKNFEKEFAGASSVEWENKGDYQVATFTFQNNRVEAFFNTETGELEGTARYVMFNQLPLLVMRTFNKNFTSTDFINALEISNAEGLSYVLTAETKNKKYNFKISADGHVLRKIKPKR